MLSFHFSPLDYLIDHWILVLRITSCHLSIPVNRLILCVFILGKPTVSPAQALAASPAKPADASRGKNKPFFLAKWFGFGKWVIRSAKIWNISIIQCSYLVRELSGSWKVDFGIFYKTYKFKYLLWILNVWRALFGRWSYLINFLCVNWVQAVAKAISVSMITTMFLHLNCFVDCFFGKFLCIFCKILHY